MNNNIIKVGIIGSGFAAKFHFDALRRVISAKIEVVGAFSKNKINLNNFTEPRGIKAFESLDALIDYCDVLHLCTPPSTHEPMAVEILKANKFVIIEKPFTGYFGNGSDSFSGKNFNREDGLKYALDSINRMLNAENNSLGKILYAENWIYSPAVQKEREVIEKTGAQILWIQGQQSHSGSHSPDYGKWYLSGGGSLMGKGCHPLAAAIYLKQVEGRTKNGAPIRPLAVSARTHNITGMASYDNKGLLRDSYNDVEDYANIHLVFEDGTFADIVASELLQGGVKNYLEVHANNHRTICNIAPNNAMQIFNPVNEILKDVYVVEKTDTKEGWSSISPDEGWFNGYQHEMDSFYDSIVNNSEIQSDSKLAADVISVVYHAYLSAALSGKEIEISKQ
jgi:predicted dehydrogenase